MKYDGFSLVELIIVIAIVMILAAAGLTGFGAIQKNMRFNNTFNRMVQMVEQARSMALTGKGTAGGYGVYFAIKAHETTNDESFNLFSDTLQADGSFPATGRTTIDSMPLPNSGGINLIAKIPPDASPKCLSGGTIFFETKTAKVSFLCNGSEPPKMMEFGIFDATHTKSFSIHKAAGIPQL